MSFKVFSIAWIKSNNFIFFEFPILTILNGAIGERLSTLSVLNLFLLFGAENNGKAILTCYVSKEIVVDKNLNAGIIVRELGTYIQGGGGGQAFFAAAGGKKPAGIHEALEKAIAYLN